MWSTAASRAATSRAASGDPQAGVHAVQMELACRGYMKEPLGPVAEGEWPTPYDEDYAAPMRAALTLILQTCLTFARSKA